MVLIILFLCRVINQGSCGGQMCICPPRPPRTLEDGRVVPVGASSRFEPRTFKDVRIEVLVLLDLLPIPF